MLFLPNLTSFKQSSSVQGSFGSLINGEGLQYQDQKYHNKNDEQQNCAEEPNLLLATLAFVQLQHRKRQPTLLQTLARWETNVSVEKPQVVLDDQLMFMVNDHGFRRLLCILEPTQKIPSHHRYDVSVGLWQCH